MKPVLYFHGFASSPASAKITVLRPLLEPRGIELITPDLNVPSFDKLDFDAVVGHALSEAKRIEPVAMVGSSMGALIALAAAQRGVAVPLVLIAPALGVARRWKEKIPGGDPVNVFNHALGTEAPIHRAFFLQMSDVQVDQTPPPSRVTVIMGQYDETVPHSIALETWNSWRLGPPSHFFTVEDGDHGLVAYSGLIAEAIVEAAEATK
jgi:uncharacterized protein